MARSSTSPWSIPAHAGEPRRPSLPCGGCTVYPRPRGGACSCRCVRGSFYGLSPPTRGSPHRVRNPVSAQRSIPAHAGEPDCTTYGTRWPRVYPRPRGGASAATSWSTADWGLSPPTRGSRSTSPVPRVPTWSIPAHAGEPSRTGSCRLAPWVYPRPRGGARARRTSRCAGWGVSPPTRGSRGAAGTESGTDRCIPAHAGEPTTTTTTSVTSGVYPRPRGGATPPDSDSPDYKGLSPPTRGSRVNRVASPPKGGSIPAPAGEPATRPRRSGTGPVYPRPRGGAARTPRRCESGKGLSPPTRGSHLRHPDRNRPVRSIPAHAGEPVRAGLHPYQGEVYPRPRGGAADAESPADRNTGLSPPTRGSRQTISVRPLAPGSIPAHAGEPKPMWHP